MKEIDSPIFGKVSLLEEDEKDFTTLKKYIEAYPVNAFGIINKLLNEKYYCIQIGVLP